MEINKNSTVMNQGSTTPTTKKSLSIDDFLQIMAAEIKNQSPMGSEGGSGSNTDYISQLAQFTTLEQMSSMAESLSLLTFMGQQQQSFSMIGKEVKLLDGDKAVTGIVDKVRFLNGYTMLEVNGKDYNLGAVLEVGK